MKFTITDLEAMNPCAEALEHYRQNNPKSAKEAWENCERSDWMIWFLRKRNLLDKPTSVKLTCAFAKHVLHIYEGKYPEDMRPRRAIKAALKWLERPNEENRKAAAAAAAAAYAAAAADAAAYAAAAATTYPRLKERKWQANQIREIVPNPFK